MSTFDAFSSLTLADAKALIQGSDALLALALERARSVTDGGKRIDDHQVTTERVAYAATEGRAARELVALLERLASEGRSDRRFELAAIAGTADLVANVRRRVAEAMDELGLDERDLDAAFPAELRARQRAASSEALLRAIGKDQIARRGRNDLPLDETLEQIRESVREFGEQEVAPRAEHIHRTDDLVPESFITKMAELGYFGLSVPEAYGGHEMGNLSMILTTEELSRCSLAAAGSLITRPEILTKALLQGGTDAQKKEWLPKIAAGEVMVGISVTEPDIGSDVAGVKCRAERATVGGREGWVINGPKAWCTFAGRADVLAVLLRTNPDPAAGGKGLSLFIVPKESFGGHAFECVQPEGGKLTGKADATPGYRGMHSFTLNFERYFVPAENLVGGEGGLGKGFYLQMGGFAAGRLQTAGRATGISQAALEKTCEYVADRNQFGHPIADFQLTQHVIGRMWVRLLGARAIAYAAAEAFDVDERAASPLASQAKLLACDIAVWLTQEGQVLHGGWGYAEEYPISRYVVDAQVLPIFEGVRPILELRVVGAALLRG
jgi:(2S)-methylsuccinyl-CoA dehydrogenase